VANIYLSTIKTTEQYTDELLPHVNMQMQTKFAYNTTSQSSLQTVLNAYYKIWNFSEMTEYIMAWWNNK